MSLVFVDGFDHYAFADMSKKWSIPGGGSFSTGTFRTGTQSYALAGSTNPFNLFPAGDAHATFIVGFAFRLASFVTSGYCGAMLLYGDAGTTSHVTLGVNPSGKLHVLRGGVSGTLLGAESGISIALNNWYYVEMKAVLHDTTGSVVVRVDGATVINLTGIDTNNAGVATTFDTITMRPDITTMFYDDLYVCNGAGSAFNDFLGDVRVQTIYPTGAGNSTGLTPSTGSNWDAVNDPTANITDYVSSAVAATKDTYAFGDVTSGYTALAAQSVLYGSKAEAGGSRSMIPVIRSGGTDYDGTAKVLPTGFIMHRSIYETNPNGAVAWTSAAMNAAEFGVKVG